MLSLMVKSNDYDDDYGYGVCLLIARLFGYVYDDDGLDFVYDDESYVVYVF